MRAISVSAAFAVLVTASGCAPPEFRDGKVHNVSTGEAFGIAIGAPADQARSILAKRLRGRFNPPRVCEGRDYRLCEGADAVYRYEATGFFPSGVVELFVTRERVSGIEWWQHAIDF